MEDFRLGFVLDLTCAPLNLEGREVVGSSDGGLSETILGPNTHRESPMTKWFLWTWSGVCSETPLGVDESLTKREWEILLCRTLSD